MQQWQCCRTCLSVLNLSPIFVIPEHHDKYAQVVLEATGVKIDLNDSLPQQMCSECINFTNEAYRFRKKCQDVQKSLTGTLNHTTFYEIKIGVVLQPDKPHFIDISSLVDEYDNVTLSEYKLELDENNSADVNNSTDVNNCTDVNNSADVNNSTDVNNCTGVNNSADVNHLEEIILDKPIEKNHKKIRTKERSKPVKRTLRKRKNDKEKKEREKEEIECEYCHKILTSKLSLRNHYKIHTGFDVVCEHCGKKFITRRLLLMHCKAKHGYEKTDKCSFCDYRASNAEQVKIHERLHTGEKPYACAACGAVFHRKSSYLQHVAIHLPEKTVQCTQCPARFKSVTLMRIHANRHRATQYTYKCVICAHNFARRRNVARHLLRIHAVQPLAEHIERNKCV